MHINYWYIVLGVVLVLGHIPEKGCSTYFFAEKASCYSEKNEVKDSMKMRYEVDDGVENEIKSGKDTWESAVAGVAFSRGEEHSPDIQILPWFSEVEKIFKIGSVASLIDVDTGMTLRVERTYGYNHADVEPLTPEDTQTLKKIAGGQWCWIRRAAIVEVNGYRIAASMTPMPHAGRDDQSTNVEVEDRSGDYGRGENLDAIKDNNMDGHFDIHFYQSRTHTTNRVDQDHQIMIQKAFRSER